MMGQDKAGSPIGAASQDNTSPIPGNVQQLLDEL